MRADTIARCAMDTRFNSFYHEDMHPFVDAMVGLMAESGARARRPGFVGYFMRSAQQKYDSDIALLKKVAAEVVAERKANPNDKKDLLNAMIKGRDAKTGEGLTEESIMNNMITFLIAGRLISSSDSPELKHHRARNYQWPSIIPLLLSLKKSSSIPNGPKTDRRGLWKRSNHSGAHV